MKDGQHVVDFGTQPHSTLRTQWLKAKRPCRTTTRKRRGLVRPMVLCLTVGQCSWFKPGQQAMESLSKRHIIGLI